ncbi:hypothetical protein ACTXT7_010748 [Hymenolepis weldensis]
MGKHQNMQDMKFYKGEYVQFYDGVFRVLDVRIMDSASIYKTVESALIWGCDDRSASASSFHFHWQRVNDTKTPHILFLLYAYILVGIVDQ